MWHPCFFAKWNAFAALILSWLHHNNFLCFYDSDDITILDDDTIAVRYGQLIIPFIGYSEIECSQCKDQKSFHIYKSMNSLIDGIMNNSF